MARKPRPSKGGQRRGNTGGGNQGNVRSASAAAGPEEQFPQRSKQRPKDRFLADIQFLVEMGFDRSRAMQALERCRGDVERAMDQLLNNVGPDSSSDEATTAASSSNVRASSSSSSNQIPVSNLARRAENDEEDAWKQLIDMGFEADAAVQALVKTNGDVARAAEFLVETDTPRRNFADEGEEERVQRKEPAKAKGQEMEAALTAQSAALIAPAPANGDLQIVAVLMEEALVEAGLEVFSEAAKGWCEEQISLDVAKVMSYFDTLKSSIGVCAGASDTNLVDAKRLVVDVEAERARLASDSKKACKKGKRRLNARMKVLMADTQYIQAKTLIESQDRLDQADLPR